jgi:hypothetical protein
MLNQRVSEAIMDTGSAAAIVVTEQTGHLSASIKDQMAGRQAVIIVAQSAGESPGAFADRVARKIVREHTRERANFAVFCCGTRDDLASWNERVRVTEWLLSAIDDRGELTICAGGEAGRRSLPRFLELVDGLCRLGSSSGKKICLQFDPRTLASHHAGGRRRDVLQTTAPWRLTA